GGRLRLDAWQLLPRRPWALVAVRTRDRAYCGQAIGRSAGIVTGMVPSSVEKVVAAFADADYIADRSLAVSVHLALQMQRPLFLEGEAGVGKTEVAKVLAQIMGTPLIRLQCYEGLDVNHAVYEWDY